MDVFVRINSPTSGGNFIENCWKLQLFLMESKVKISHPLGPSVLEKCWTICL